MNIVSSLLIFAIPILILIGFIVSVIGYKTCPLENAGKKKNWKAAMLATGIVSAIFIGILVLLLSLLTLIMIGM